MRRLKIFTLSVAVAGLLALDAIGLTSANAVAASTPICADSVQKAVSNRAGTQGTYRVSGMASTTDLLNCANPALQIATNTSANDVWDYYLSFSPASFGALTPYLGNQITIDITGSPDAAGYEVSVVDTATSPATVFQQTETLSRNFGQTQSGPQTKSLSINLSPTQITHLMNGDFVVMVNYVGGYVTQNNLLNVDTITSISLAGYSTSTPSAGPSVSGADNSSTSNTLASTGANGSDWTFGAFGLIAGGAVILAARARAKRHTL